MCLRASERGVYSHTHGYSADNHVLSVVTREPQDVLGVLKRVDVIWSITRDCGMR